MDSQQPTVLVIGRGIFTLAMIRILYAADDGQNNEILLGSTSSSTYDFGTFSRYVDTTIALPRPDHDFTAFENAVRRLVQQYPSLRTIVPVGEEAIFLSRIQIDLGVRCVTTPLVLPELNEKYQFQVLLAAMQGSCADLPCTQLVRDTQRDLAAAVKKGLATGGGGGGGATSSVILKPLVGHGSIGACVVEQQDICGKSAAELEAYLHSITLPGVSYVVQEFVHGREVSTYSFCKQGKVVAHVCYEPQCVATLGFSPLRTTTTASPSLQKRTLDFVAKLAASLHLTGSFGFDFMERFNGELVALECNPRVTSGIVFFTPRFSPRASQQLRRAILEDGSWDGDLVVPDELCSIMTTLPAISCISKARSNNEAVAVLESIVASYDDIWYGRDPFPMVYALLRYISLFVYGSFVALLSLGSTSVTEAVRKIIVDEIVAYETPSKGTGLLQTASVGGKLNSDEKKFAPKQPKTKDLRILVTGATGFLGGRLVEILDRGFGDDESIRLPFAASAIQSITATGRNQEKGARLIASLGPNTKATFVACNLQDIQTTYELVKDHDIVFHCAALCSLWKRWEEFKAANVRAAENIVESSCLSGTVQLLVHISSPSVCCGLEGVERMGIQECEPLAPDDHQPTRYAATKKMAEEIVTKVATINKLPCIMLRPRAIFGPGDPTLFPKLVDRLKRKKLPLISGMKTCLGDYTYVDNVAYACACCVGQSPSSVRVYSITNGEPRRFWEVIELVCKFKKLQQPWKRVPRWAAKYVAVALEGLSFGLLLLGVEAEPMLMRYTLNVISVSCTFDIGDARKDLNYKPVVSLEEGINRTFGDGIRKTLLKRISRNMIRKS